MNPYVIAMAILGAVLLHMAGLFMAIWLTSVSPILGAAFMLGWIAGLIILIAVFASKS